VWGKGSEVVLGEKSGMGRGGMGSKITAALVAANGGVTTCVASGLCCLYVYIYSGKIILTY